MLKKQVVLAADGGTTGADDDLATRGFKNVGERA